MSINLLKVSKDGGDQSPKCIQSKISCQVIFKFLFDEFIIGFDQKPENQNHKPVRTYLDHFQITLEADFRYATLLKPN